MPENIRRKSIEVMQWLQFIVVCAGVSGIFMDIGRKTELITNTSRELHELKAIVQDLVKYQLNTATTDAIHQTVLDDLKERVVILERKL